MADMLAHSKFPRSHNVMTPKDEILKSRDLAEEMWKAIRTAVPKATCHLLTGNHEARVFKRVFERAPELESFVSVKEFFTFDGVETIHDPREELVIDDVVYIHGFLSGLGKHAAYYQKSVVCGHTHLGGVAFIRQKKKIIFELNAGMLANERAPALSYTPTKFTRWTVGYGLIDNLGPRFVCLGEHI